MTIKEIVIGGLYEFTTETNFKFNPYLCLKIYDDKYVFLNVKNNVKEVWYHKEIYTLLSVIKLS